ncbi:hypothetical protein [Phenylobacterium sp.]|jgi:hypothetical protein|uniref:hypothetical protein n=1 Tax=Phenylobacterium sp. TaxID=1871053 RepID=UPI002F4213EE
MSFAAWRPRLGLAPRACLLVAVLLVAAPAMAQTYDGDWAGALNVGGQTLHLVLHVKTEGGTSNATMDSLDQGATIPSSAVKTDGGELSILFLSIGGEFKAKLSPDGTALSGTWTQGGTMPLTMTKKAAK